jgi:hypothetical protein
MLASPRRGYIPPAEAEERYHAQFDTLDTVSLDSSYDFGNRFSVLANAVNMTGDRELGTLGVGVRYERSGAFVETTVSQFSGGSDHQVIGLEVGYVFGGGTTFESRDWNGLLGLR